MEGRDLLQYGIDEWSRVHEEIGGDVRQLEIPDETVAGTAGGREGHRQRGHCRAHKSEVDESTRSYRPPRPGIVTESTQDSLSEAHLRGGRVVVEREADLRPDHDRDPQIRPGERGTHERVEVGTHTGGEVG